MSHHANEGYLPDEIRQRLGATGEFPEGKVTPEDEGEIKIAIGSKTGTVCMEFGKPIAWIGFTPQQARQIAVTLMEHAAHSYEIGHNKDAGECVNGQPKPTTEG